MPERLPAIPKLILFDLDDTLCDHARSLDIRLQYAFTPLFGNPTDLEVVVAESQRRAWEGVEHFPELLAEFGVRDVELVKLAEERYFSDRYRGLLLYPDSLAAIQAAKQIAKTGLVTNGPTAMQQAKLDRLGIEPLFDVVLISESVGYWKPDPRIFQLALERVGVEPGEAVYVGDSPTSDVAGARAAGIPVVWMNRSGESWLGPDPPEREVRDLVEFVSLLGVELPECVYA